MSYPLSTAEAVLRLNFTQHRRTFCPVKFLLSTAEAVLRLDSDTTRVRWLLYFYCLPLRRYWDKDQRSSRVSQLQNFYCLPLRRYWDKFNAIISCPNDISIVYRWGGIETSGAGADIYQHVHFYCLPLRRYWDCHRLLRLMRSSHNISIVYRWGGIETLENFLKWTIVLISIVYRWGGIETHLCLVCYFVFQFLLSTAEAVLRHDVPVVRHSLIFLLSTAEAVLRPNTNFFIFLWIISIVYRWGGIETFYAADNFFPIFISIVYRWGGIETKMTLMHSPQDSHISIVYRWGGIETLLFFYLLIIRERYTWWQRKALFQEQTMQAWLIGNKGRNSVIM